MPHVPQEVINAIVDFVEDPESLKPCSLASSQFCEPCQRILFHKLSIVQNSVLNSSYGGVMTIERASTTLTRSPHLALYVRDLSISVMNLPEDLATLLSIINALKHVECLVIRGHVLDQTSIPSGLMTATLDVIARPCFRHLCLLHVFHLPVWFVSHVLSSVRLLTLRGVHVSSTDAATHLTRPLIASNLEDLTIITSVRYGGSIVEVSTLIAGDNNPEGLPRLQRLCLSNPFGSPLERFSRIFAAASRTLQHLELYHVPSGTSSATGTSTITYVSPSLYCRAEGPGVPSTPIHPAPCIAQ
jgi:hypothetical protein